MRRAIVVPMVFLAVAVGLTPGSASADPPEDVRAEGNGRSVRFQWVDAMYPSYDHIEIRQRRGDDPITSPSQGHKVFSGKGASWGPAWNLSRYHFVRGLDNDVMYSFGMFAYNAGGDVVWRDHWELKANDVVGPMLPGLLDRDFRGTRSVTVWWKNPPDPDLASVEVKLFREDLKDFSVYSERRVLRDVPPLEVERVTFDGLGDAETVTVFVEPYDDQDRQGERYGMGIRTNYATRIRFAMSDDEVRPGESIRIVGHLEAYEFEESPGWSAIFDRRVTLHRRLIGADSWEKIDAAYSESAPIGDPRQGRVVFSVEPRQNTEYQMRFDGGPSFAPSGGTNYSLAASGSGIAGTRSRVRAALVRPRVRAHAVSSVVDAGSLVRIRGRVSPTRARGFVKLFRRTPDGWVVARRDEIRADGTFRLRHRPVGDGRRVYRVRREPTRRFASSVSAPIEVRLR